MSSDVAVRLRSVTKRFPAEASWTWRSAVPWLEPHLRDDSALVDVDLEAAPGSALGIIGPNGAGKSTLLKLLAGVLAPTTGTVEVEGRIGAMIELGLGFHPHLTGRENVVASGLLLGVGQREMLERVDAIAEFSGLEEALDAPIREYSTGMVARLGFATAVHVDADVLIVDEVLSVGDREFQERCLRRIQAMVAAGTTLVFVSHELPLVRAVCDRVVVLREGRLVDDGPADRVVESYLGRRQAPDDRDRGAVVIRDLRLDRDEVPVEGAIGFEAVVEVADPRRLASLQVLLTLPSIDPDLVMVESPKHRLGALGRPGRFLLRGETTSLPLIGGRLRCTLQALSGEGTVLASASQDLRMEGPLRLVKPMYNLQASHRIVPIADRHPGPPARPARTVAEPVLVASGVRKAFRTGGRSRALAAVPGVHRAAGDEHEVLRGVDVSVGRGDCLGVVGPNGAGKSTLLRCLAGISPIDGGQVDRRGRAIAMLELGLGFRGDLSGWENLRSMAVYLGAGRGELAAKQAQILEFSGVAHAMDQPVKHWSSGMRARLGFALATHLTCDVLLVDEALAVGDQEFRRQAVRRLHELRDGGVAVVFVSHDLALVTEVCDVAVRLEAGTIVDEGEASDVIERYGGVGWSGGSAIGSAPVRVHDVTVLDPRIPTGASARIAGMVEVAAPSPHVRLELSLRDPIGQQLPEPMNPHNVELYSAANVVVAPEGALEAPGWYRFEADSGPLRGFGDFHFVLAAVDALEGTYIADSWATVQVGGGKRVDTDLPGTFEFDVDLDITES